MAGDLVGVVGLEAAFDEIFGARRASGGWWSTIAAGSSASTAGWRPSRERSAARARPGDSTGRWPLPGGSGRSGGGPRSEDRRRSCDGLVALLRPQHLHPPAGPGTVGGDRQGAARPAAEPHAAERLLTGFGVQDRGRAGRPGRARDHPETSVVCNGRRGSTTIASAAGSDRGTAASGCARRCATRATSTSTLWARSSGSIALPRYARQLGLGTRTGIEIRARRRAWFRTRPGARARGYPWYAGETISVSIGQGPLLVTPLQIATMMATVANGGWQVSPIWWESEAESIDRHRSEHLAIVREALSAVVNDGGTGSGRRRGHRGAGKTATVQVVEQVTWIDSEDLPYERATMPGSPPSRRRRPSAGGGRLRRAWRPRLEAAAPVAKTGL